VKQSTEVFRVLYVEVPSRKKALYRQVVLQTKKNNNNTSEPFRNAQVKWYVVLYDDGSVKPG